MADPQVEFGANVMPWFAGRIGLCALKRENMPFIAANTQK
jgi:hypothetical protein